MSKSLGNLVFVSATCCKTWDPRAIRLGVVGAPLPRLRGSGTTTLHARGRRAPRALAGRGRRRATAASTRCGPRLDDDLDTPARGRRHRRRGRRGAGRRRRGGAARRRPVPSDRPHGRRPSGPIATAAPVSRLRRSVRHDAVAEHRRARRKAGESWHVRRAAVVGRPADPDAAVPVRLAASRSRASSTSRPRAARIIGPNHISVLDSFFVPARRCPGASPTWARPSTWTTGRPSTCSRPSA